MAFFSSFYMYIHGCVHCTHRCTYTTQIYTHAYWTMRLIEQLLRSNIGLQGAYRATMINQDREKMPNAVVWVKEKGTGSGNKSGI